MYPKNLMYTEEHEWIRLAGKRGVIGITGFAQEQLGDVVFVELPAIDEVINKGESFGVIESVKTVSDLYMPVSGKIMSINEGLNDSPELVNEDPYGNGWLIEIELLDESQLKELMDSETYKNNLE